ncbi:MAG: GTP-binding protein Era [Candidatus Latescibacterota bacterium]|jgi:GTP-binding protein Era
MNSNPPTSSLQTSPSNTRCGYVALVGRPNAGKSTLFNAFIGQRLSIVTAKPQTTRGRVLGILTRPESQVVFLDTPGLLEPSYKLHESMERQIEQAAREADTALLLIDGTKPRDRAKLVHRFLERARTPVIAVLNKIDLLEPKIIDNLLEQLRKEYGLQELLPISALHGAHLETLLERIDGQMPQGPKLYPDDMVAEQPERFFAAELIREAAFENLEDELPYSINISIEEFKERPEGKTYINAVLYVERDSQKGIVIGRKGVRLHAIGKQARKGIEEMLEQSVYLELWVKVRPGWRNQDRDLREFGYL